MFKNSRLNVVMVLHINHPQELSFQFAQKITQLSGVILLNQSVLLKGVNDSIEVLSELCLSLFDLGILPYYLHMLDKVQGAQYFLVKDEYAIQLHQQLKNNLSGYLVPKLVRDNNNHSKDWLL
jgi:L-lysine 2,3-aminomutase